MQLVTVIIQTRTFRHGCNAKADRSGRSYETRLTVNLSVYFASTYRKMAKE